ncbi:MAG: hypothetical protein K9J13_06245 [Saprospiraceae bacterium]|nr:hypothetical protein [Saprospiraceae bacterium]
MRIINLIILSILSISLFGQNYNYKADIEAIKQNGFHKILLSPEITSQLNNQFFDIRLYNAETEIPYILYKESAVTEQELFVEYEITEIEHKKAQRYTRIVIHNPNKTEINNIVLRIKNSDVRKRLKLNASYNQQEWYVLKDNYYYNSIYNSPNTSEIRVLNFPLSDYEYYELLIDDFFDKPINIIQAGYYNLVKENGKYTELKNIAFTTIDTLKETIITLPVGGNYIDKISFEIDTPKYYYREAEIFVKRTKNLKKKKLAYDEIIGSFNLISNSSNTFIVNNLKEDTIYIRIKNNDNLKLNINKISLFQLNKYITAELNAGSNYYLKYSDKNAKKPNYDLSYFTDSIPANLPTIKTKTPKKILNPDETDKSGNFEIRNYWLWISIIIVAVFLFYMSFKMIRENKKSDSQ